jgi:hypothetical protein
MAPTLSTSGLVLEEQIWQGPAQITLEDIAKITSELVPEPTTAWRKDQTEKPYDFPNTYCDPVQVPITWMTWDPISTYTVEQNTIFDQHYLQKK